MASTFTPNLKLEKQGTGDNANTWGVVLNNQITLLEEAISDCLIYTATDGTNYLTATNGLSDEVRKGSVLVQGALTTTASIIYPDSVEFTKFVFNKTSGGKTITVKNSSGTGVTIPNGAGCVVFSDGTSIRACAPAGTPTGAIIATSIGASVLTTDTFTANTATISNVTATTATVSTISATSISTDKLRVLTATSVAGNIVSNANIIADGAVSCNTLAVTSSGAIGGGLTVNSNSVIGGTTSIMNGEGHNPNYRLTIQGVQGGSAALCFERVTDAGSGTYLESKVKNATGNGVANGVGGLNLSSSWNNTTNTLTPSCARYTHFVDGTPTANGVPGAHQFTTKDADGVESIHTRLRNDGSVEHRFTESTTRTPVSFLRVVATCNGESVSVNRGVNVASISEVSTARYRLNFGFTMPDNNYTVSILLGGSDVTTTDSGWLQAKIRVKTTTYVEFLCVDGDYGGSALKRPKIIDIQIER